MTGRRPASSNARPTGLFVPPSIRRSGEARPLAEVERMSNTPLPPQQRAERMKVLEEEIDQLQRVEEVLIAREGAERSTNCAPAWPAGGRRARCSRRVTFDQQRDLRLSAFECPRGMRPPLSPTADIQSRGSVVA